MIEHLFGSRTRLKLLTLFFHQAGESFYVRQLSRLTGEHMNSVRRELSNLKTLDIVHETIDHHKNFYKINAQCTLYAELRALILKGQLMQEKKFIQRFTTMGDVQLLVLLGYFVDDTTSAIDLFIVGELSQANVQILLDEFNQRFGQNLRYTLMTANEYQYRREVTDKFLFTILQAPQIELVNRL